MLAVVDLEKDGILTINKKGNQKRIFISIDGKSQGFMREKQDGSISWYNKFNNKHETKVFTSKEQIIEQIKDVQKGSTSSAPKAFKKKLPIKEQEQKEEQKPIEQKQPEPEPVKEPVKQEVKHEQVNDSSKELIPEMFTYYNPDDNINNLETLEQALDEKKNVLLVGPTGSGKTTMVRYYCAKRKLPYRRVSLNGGATAEDLIGHYILKTNGGGSMTTIWVDGVLVQAMKNGWVLVIDEINGSPAEILFVLNSVLDDERMLCLTQKDGEVIHPHPNFRVVSTCNPTDMGYAGTNEINEALRDRFHVTLWIDYNEKVEHKILKDMKFSTEQRKDIMNLVKYLRESYIKSELITPFSTRSVMNFAQFLKDGHPNLILNRFRESEKSTVSDLLDVFIHKTKSIEEVLGELSGNEEDDDN